jgi:uncharacterized protein HemX
MGNERDHGGETVATTVVVLLLILVGVLGLGGGLLYFARGSVVQAHAAARAMADEQRARAEVERARAEALAAQAEAAAANSLTLQLAADGQLTLNGTSIELPELKTALAQGADKK